MRSAPPEVVATWPKPNYIDPQSQGPDLIVAGLFTLVLALGCLGLRLYVRLGVMRKAEMDDWVMVVATVRQRRIPACCRRAIARCFFCTHEQRTFLDHVEQFRHLSHTHQFLRCVVLCATLLLASRSANYLADSSSRHSI